MFCQLLESSQIHGLFYVKTDSSVPHDISRVINRYATRHQQDLHLCSYKTTPLSGPTHVTDLDLMSLSESLSHEFSVSLQGGGTAHLLLYWFEMDYGCPSKVATYHPEEPDKSWHYKQSMITFQRPVTVGNELKVTFLYQSGLVDFVVSDVQ